MFCRHVFGNISGGFRGISRFFGNFAEIPEIRGSATARNIRSPVVFEEMGKLEYLEKKTFRSMGKEPTYKLKPHTCMVSTLGLEPRILW